MGELDDLVATPPGRRNRGEPAQRLRALIRIAVAVTRSDVDELDAEIERSLQTAARAVDADIAALTGQLDDRLETRLQWRGVGWMDPPFGLALAAMPWWAARARAGHEIIIDEVDALPAAAAAEQALLRARETKAIAALPCGGPGRVLGYLVLERRRECRWSAADLRFAVLYADVLAAALERRGREASLARAAEGAETASRAKTVLLASLAHELKTPLSALIGFADLLDSDLGGTLSDKQREFVREIGEAAQSMRALVDDTLDIAQLDVQRLPLSIAETPVRAILLGALSQVGSLADHARVELRHELCPRELIVLADGGKLRQIVLNLLTNAIKFTLAGGTVTLRSRELSEREYELEVEDSGVGIAPRDRELIFESFARADSPDGTRREGAGLGLALARRLARAHGGDIALESAPGRGSVFRARLPRDARPFAPGRQAFLGGLV